MISKKPIMQQFLNDRNRHELAGGFDYYKTGIKKMAEFKQAKKRAKKISQIAEGIELAEIRKDFKSIYS